MGRRHEVVAGVIALGVALILAGCATSAPATSPTAVSTASWPVINMHGKGPATTSVTTPAGAHSLRLAFVCTNGEFLINTNSALKNDRSGACGGTRDYRLALPDEPQTTLTVTVPADATFSLVARFDRRLFSPNTAMSHTCTSMSKVDGTIQNAQASYAAGALPAAGWNAAVTRAQSELRGASASAPGLIRQQLPAVARWLSGAHSTPAALNANSAASGADAANTLINQVCADNNTPIAFHASGG